MAICFILRSDLDRYKRLLEDLKSLANLGRDGYPETLTEAFDLLVRESGEYDTVCTVSSRYRQRGGRGGRGRQDFLFMQQGRGGHGNGNITYSRTNQEDSNEVVAGTDGEIFPNIICFGCNFHWHYRNTYPYATQTGIVSMHVGYMLIQDQSFVIPKSWLLLDTCSTCDVLNNPNLVTHICTCTPDKVLHAYTNGGVQKFEQLVELSILPVAVHFKRDSMVTTLSLKTVSEIPGARLTMDTQVNKNIALTLNNGRVFVFISTQEWIILFLHKHKLN